MDKELLLKAKNGDNESIIKLAEILYEDKEKGVFYWLKEALKRNPYNVEILDKIGRCYTDGLDTESDREQAKIYFKKAADLGYPPSEGAYAWLLREEKNPSCVAWFEKAYEHGESLAAINLSHMYFDGDITEKDPNRGLAWLMKAVEMDDIAAVGELGSRYLTGDGVDINIEEGLKWSTIAGEAGDGICAANVSRVYENGECVNPDINKAVSWAVKAANFGDTSQAMHLAELYFRGQDGVPQDNKKAFGLFLVAAQNGNPDAMGIVGTMYLRAYGVDPDIKEALYWYTQAKNNGNVDACLRLAKGYLKNGYAGTDFSRAAEYLEEAYKMGSVEGARILGHLYENGEGVSQNPQKAFELFQFAAYNGDPFSMGELATAYREGTYVEKDLNKSEDWFRKALEGLTVVAENKNSIEAILALGELYGNRKTSEDIEEALKWYDKAADRGNLHAAHCATLLSSILASGSIVAAHHSEYADAWEWSLDGDIEKHRQCIERELRLINSGDYQVTSDILDDVNREKENNAHDRAMCYYFLDRYQDVCKVLTNMDSQKSRILFTTSALFGDVNIDKQFLYQKVKFLETDLSFDPNNDPQYYEEVPYGTCMQFLANYHKSIGGDDLTISVSILDRALSVIKNPKLKEVLTNERNSYNIKPTNNRNQGNSRQSKEGVSAPPNKPSNSKKLLLIACSIALLIIMIFVVSNSDNNGSSEISDYGEESVNNDTNYEGISDNDDATNFEDETVNDKAEYSDDSIFDYSKVLDLSNYDWLEGYSFSFYAPVSLYSEVDADADDDRFYYSTNNDSESIYFRCIPIGRYEYDFETPDELIDLICEEKENEGGSIILKKYMKDDSEGLGRLVYDIPDEHLYCAMTFSDEDVYFMEIKTREPESDEEAKWMDYYINVLYRGCSFTRNVGEIYTYEEYLKEQ